MAKEKVVLAVSVNTALREQVRDAALFCGTKGDALTVSDIVASGIKKELAAIKRKHKVEAIPNRRAGSEVKAGRPLKEK